MRKSENLNSKLDFKFIAIIIAIIVVLSCFSGLVNKEEGNIDISDLPEISQNEINKLVISEVMSNNAGIYANNENVACDYVEIYNGTEKTINLSGYGLSDKSDSVKWLFPETYIEPKAYLVVNLTGENKEGLNANFKLSAAGGETIILVNRNKKVIDAVKTVALSKNQVMVRDNTGNWIVALYASPGHENSMLGYNQYLESIIEIGEEKLAVNEIFPNNQGNFVNEDGLMVGYLEFKNVSEEAINLADYSLGVSLDNPFRYHFDNVTLLPGEIYSLYMASGGLYQGNYSGFSLNNKNGKVLLGYQGKIITEVSYENLANGLAYARNEAGEYVVTNGLSLGYENNNEGIESFAATYQKEKYNGLIINEVMSNNKEYLAQNGGNYYDWIEFYNNSEEAINLADYYLTNNDDYLFTYRLPEITLQANEYFVLMCSGDTNLTNQSYYHANFKISSNESIFLIKNNKIVDSIFVYDIPLNCSYGRASDYGFIYMSNPTPGKTNSTGYRTITSAPEIMMAAGIYNNVDYLLVEIKSEGTIYYTLDGSVPTTSSKVYLEPLTISSTTVLKAKALDEGAMLSSLSAASYIVNENHTIPVVSVSLNPSLFSYMNAHTWSTEEYQCYAELFEEESSFSIPCSISLMGGNARNFAKHNFTLRFDSDWGASSLNYPLFSNRDNSCYDAIVLRSGSNDWDKSIIRDVLSTSLVDDYTEVDVQAYKTCILYINGNYWGIYNIREKINAQFISDHYNVDRTLTNLARIDGETQSGSIAGFKKIEAYCQSHSLTSQENYEYICSLVDINNVADYWICQMFLGNMDVFNIRFFSNPQIVDGKWRYILYDCDFGFYYYTTNYYTRYLANPKGMTGFVENTYDNSLIRKLLQNSSFRQLWLERLAYHLNNTFSKENMTNRLNELTAMLEPEIARDRARWKGLGNLVEVFETQSEEGSGEETQPTYVRHIVSVATYNYNISLIRNFINNRPRYVLNQTKAFFSLSDSQMKEIFKDLW